MNQDCTGMVRLAVAMGVLQDMLNFCAQTRIGSDGSKFYMWDEMQTERRIRRRLFVDFRPEELTDDDGAGGCGGGCGGRGNAVSLADVRSGLRGDGGAGGSGGVGEDVPSPAETLVAGVSVKEEQTVVASVSPAAAPEAANTDLQTTELPAPPASATDLHIPAAAPSEAEYTPPSETEFTTDSQL